MSVGRTGATSERLQLATRASELREQGLLQREIAAALGVSRSYAQQLLTDPDGSGSRARKDTYRGACIDCGDPTDGSNGRTGTPERCAPCREAWQHAQKVWTREAVIDAIQRWTSEHGRAPFALDWLHADTERGYPNRGSVYRSRGNDGSPFATWNDAIRAAGFAATPPGKRGIGPRAKRVLAVLADGEPRRFAQILRSAGCTSSSGPFVLRALIDRGLIVRLERGLYVLASHENRLAA